MLANAERYEARYQANWKLTDKLSWFVGLRGEQDRFSGFAYQATASTGVTYKFEATGELDPAQVIVWAFKVQGGKVVPDQEIPKS